VNLRGVSWRGRLARDDSRKSFVAFHYRARSVRGSHPAVTVVANHKSDNCAAHLLSHKRAREENRTKGPHQHMATSMSPSVLSQRAAS